MDSLCDDIIKLVMTFLIPKPECLLHGSHNFMAYFCVNKYITNIKIEKKWNTCTNKKIFDKRFCAQHSENYKDCIEINKKIQNLSIYPREIGNYIHFDTKKQADISKQYIYLSKYCAGQGCCFGKGYLLS